MNKRIAGVAIPVFSLRSKKSFGTGEFSDLKLLVDWAKESGISMIQLLPINDTTSTHTWRDSYPYSAISVFALHPLYINLSKVGGKEYAHLIKPLARKQKQLNNLSDLDYEQVMKFKMSVLKELFEAKKKALKKDKAYADFVESNKQWLKPYASFCFLRDKYNTADYSKWKTSVSKTSEVNLHLYYFIQYHLHLQLKEAVQYAHVNKIELKGDIAIGVNRYSADTWQFPQLFNLDMQAGAPPDAFSAKGQNWSFPTYKWTEMEKDGYTWWLSRLQQMNKHFDALRLDHILGFFRIWSIPVNAIEGSLGHFVPALPLTIAELEQRGIVFDYTRYCKPFITDEILNKLFNNNAQHVKETFLDNNFQLKPEFDTQRKIEQYLETGDPLNIKQGLFDLITNIILIQDSSAPSSNFHFRIDMDKTLSFSYLDEHCKYVLKELYDDYFYKRQDKLWASEGRKKLNVLKNSTAMLVCGEDLGMIPASVPNVMKELGILSLEIQRMPKQSNVEFFNPKDASYLSVVSPSTHDISTIREWWEEDRLKSQRFYNTMLDYEGQAPYFCEPWVVKSIIAQHLNSPAMIAMFQLQDLMGLDGKLRRQIPQEERINQPDNPNHYWRYRMHITLEELIEQKDFNKELSQLIKDSER
jgi:4-alpha-glucanotransferase